jgi:hypothetical protein
MRAISVLCSVVFLLCLMALPVIDYAGGRSCMPLCAPLVLLPAEVVPLGIGFLLVIILVLTVVRSFLARRHRAWTIGALTVVIGAAYVYWFQLPEFPGFLEGLRDRFAMRVGYPKMREFAREMAQTGPEAIIARPGKWNPPTVENQKRWADLVVRYPFLEWNHATGTVLVRGGIVELTWGSALVGHWGFQVAPGGKANDPKEDRCRILRVSDDILFINYFD